tara:strand:+ start:360 stop:485 length:126 start_codon:yes stop_codon:yes gene_type:complete
LSDSLGRYLDRGTGGGGGGQASFANGMESGDGDFTDDEESR